MAHRLYQQVADRADHFCEYCFAPEDYFNQEFEVDHVVARAQGGADDLQNLALACRSCNLRKREHSVALDPETGIVVALFNPRQDSWDDHFWFNVSTYLIEGSTPIGRATIIQLGMNRHQQVRARKRWFQRKALEE